MSHPLLSDYPVTVTIPVQWGDIDAYGHVNNTVFFKLFESARIAYLEACGFLDAYENDRIGAILHSTSCRFRHALNFPDHVVVGSRATDIQPDRFEMKYAIVSTMNNHLAGEGAGLIVSFDYARHEKTSIPDAVRRGIEQLETGL